MNESHRKTAYGLCARAIDEYFRLVPEIAHEVLVEALLIRDAMEIAGKVPAMVDTHVVLVIAPAIITNGNGKPHG